ncbi:cytochrome c3 family protein, partial [bacterium]|nr:cytochrome c3 family protein [bacterium]
MVSSGPFFPAWADTLARLVIALVVGGLVYLVVLTLYGVSPKTTSSGYMPEQPVAYSHALHAGELGIDCRYCHTAVERAPVAAVPNTQICMNCHTNIRSESEKLKRIRESNESGMPIPWVRIHDLPDFVYFNHSAHVRRGIGCVSCHGRIDEIRLHCLPRGTGVRHQFLQCGPLSQQPPPVRRMGRRIRLQEESLLG